MTHEPAARKREYILVFWALMVLLVVTVAVAFVPLGPFNLIAALTIAIIKALLVILFFMHAKSSDRIIWIFICAGVVWLAILIGGTAHDVLTRGWF